MTAKELLGQLRLAIAARPEVANYEVFHLIDQDLMDHAVESHVKGEAVPTLISVVGLNPGIKVDGQSYLVLE